MGKFTQYQTFVAIAETGSLSAASRALHITPSAVSKQISTLETSLGVVLIERTNRRVSLTREGQDFYQNCTQILNSIQRAEEIAKQNHQEISGQLAISFPSSLSRAACFDIFTEFLKRNPNIQLRLSLTDDIDSLLHGGIDFAFRLGAPPDSSRLSSTPLCTSHLVMCAAPSYIQANGILNSVADFENHRFILTRPDQASPSIKSYIKEHKITFTTRNSHITNSGEATHQLVLDGCGIGLFLDLNVNQDLESGELIEIYPAAQLPAKKLYLVYKQYEPPSQKQGVFQRFAEEFFSVKA